MEIDGQKLKVVIVSLFLIYFLYHFKTFFKELLMYLLMYCHGIAEVFLGVGEIFTSPSSEVFSLCLVAIAFITLIAVFKLLTRKN